MVAFAESIGHGSEYTKYITGESRNKEHPELIYHVKNQFLDNGLDAYGIWFKMRQHAPMKNNVISVILSPSIDDTRHFTMEDWSKLWDDFVREFDNIEQTKDGKVFSHKTNLAGSMATVHLHLESESGIPHLHGAVCRVDNNGVTNNDHQILRRAQLAGERVSRQRGWEVATDIQERRIDTISADCIAILKSMPSWDWDDYVARLKSKGYGVKVMFDKKKLPHGYSILVGNSSYKASDLGKGRNLMVSKIEKTWQKLHPDTQTVLKQSEGREGNNLASTPKQSVRQIASIPDAERISGYSEWRDGSVPYTATHDGKQHNLYIPGRVLDLFNDEFDYREVANYEELTNFAVAIFVGLTALDTVSTGGGGGGGNNDGWRDRKDEDEIERARRCARAAAAKLGKTPKPGRKR